MADQRNEAPSPEVVLDELLRTVQESLRFAGSVIRGEEFDRGGTAVGTAFPTLSDRLNAAHHIIEAGAPLAERLFDLQRNRRRLSVS